MSHKAMLKRVFNAPANPFRDKNEPVFLTVGDLLTALAVTVAITGTAYGIVNYGDDVIDYISSQANFSSVLEQGEVTSSAPHLTIG